MATRGEKVIRFIEGYCRVPEGAKVGQSIVLEDFQRDFILSVYDNPHGSHTGILSIARKNGKSALIAGIVLAHLIGPEAQQNSQIVSGAMSREQASIIFNLAVKMIRLNTDLEGLVHIIPSSKRLIGLPMNVEYKALSAEGKTTHGLSPILAILDETGQVKGSQDEFVDAVTTAQGAHDDPLLLCISTQAAEDADLLSVWIDDAAESGDPHIISHVYAAGKDAPVNDQEAWAAANPALGVFRKRSDLEKQAEKARRMPAFENTFRNLCLNQRVSTVAPFVSKSVWESCGERPVPLEGMTVYGGLDLSTRTDLTALVLVGMSRGVWHVWPIFWTPEEGLLERAKRDRWPYDQWAREGYLRTTPGATVDYSYVMRDIADLMRDCEVAGIAYDRYRIDLLRREAESIGVNLPLLEHGQGYKDMAPALDTLESELLNGRMNHGMNPVMTMCASGAVVTQDAAGNRKLDKSKATSRIDGMVALAMAMRMASTEVEIDGLLDDFISSPLSF
ncbi:terminase large subunit [Kushneria phosphatilytica]|uniref:Terminase large subunit n=1 Tax=Kushneria phosphatilytica TaxID=657387 RepID=A0A1S1NXG6_9GAMM|nr:terminase TerL endonuclease subunit [Kushneria phosphatilytica]OHV12127.1 terminase [Kushneria phosphatilytica]QEL11322.1 terminase large subunit [Kushneria phosphatilytica]